jgi:hypothetical protein
VTIPERHEAAPPSARRVGPTRIGLVVVVTGFVISRVVYALVGVRFDAVAIQPTQAIQDQWQLLDLGLLRHDLWSSIWYLHSQPPLYNLFCGLLLALPRSFQVPVAASCFLVLGAAFAVATYLLALELRLPAWASATVALLVVLNPATILYENWLSWSYPAAVFVTVGAYLLARFLRDRRWGWGVGAFGCFAVVLLDDSVFQWIWLVLLPVGLVLVARVGWRRIASVAVVPLLVVGAWYVKDAVQFGTDTTSSWVGMNLASTTVGPAPRAQLQEMVRQGILSPIVLVSPFSAVGVFVPKYTRPAHTGVAALDERTTSNGGTNFNNIAYIDVSRQYLSNDLTYLRHHPGRYLHNVVTSMRIWVVPSDQYPFLNSNFVHITPYADAFDAGVLWQATSAPTLAPGFEPALGGPPPSGGEMSYLKMLEYVLAIFVFPVAVVYRRGDRVFAGVGVVLWLTVVYDLLTTSLISLGENNRFSFELGSLPALAAAGALAFVVGRGRARWARRRGAPAEGRSVPQSI